MKVGQVVKGVKSKHNLELKNTCFVVVPGLITNL